MPQRKSANSLYSVACGSVADLLLVGCEAIDKEWEPPLPDNLPRSPTSSPIKSPPPPFNDAIKKTHAILREWVENLPDSVLETVVKELLNKVELQLLEDKDKKLIMTLINIEKMKMNDFFFGVHSLLAILKGSSIANLHTTKRLWYCLWEYEEITSSNLLSDTLCHSLPGLPGLVRLDLSHVASDRLLIAISYKCPLLKHLCISHGSVSDKGVRALCGVTPVLSSPSRNPSRNLCFEDCVASMSNSSQVRSFGASFSGGLIGSRPVQIPAPSSRPFSPPHRPFSPPGSHSSPSKHFSPPGGHFSPSKNSTGCARLEHLDLQSCNSISDTAVWTCLENLGNLRALLYQERQSVFEILIKQGSLMDEEVRGRTRFKLNQLEHGFPYGLSPPLEQFNHVVALCPYVTSINMVTEDRCMPIMALFPHLERLTVELEDCVGDGFMEFVGVAGSRLTELVISCSSDPESNLHHVEGGGQQGQLFNLVVYAVGIHCPQVRKLSVSGCGLVSSVTINNLDLNSKLGNKSWLNNQSKIWFKELQNILLMSYEDTSDPMRVHLDLFRSVLKAAKNLCVLSLEGNFGTFFTDSYLLDAMRVNPLQKLRILDICETGVGGQPGRIPLTMASVKILLEHCNFLRELRISDWAVSDQEFQEIKDMVSLNNWNLLLTRKLA